MAGSTLRIMVPLIRGLRMNRAALLAGFSPGVFAADAALELVGQGVSFRDAYRQVKQRLPELERMDPHQVIARKRHLGASAGLDFRLLAERIRVERRFVRQETRRYYRTISRLLGVTYPL